MKTSFTLSLVQYCIYSGGLEECDLNIFKTKIPTQVKSRPLLGLLQTLRLQTPCLSEAGWGRGLVPLAGTRAWEGFL